VALGIGLWSAHPGIASATTDGDGSSSHDSPAKGSAGSSSGSGESGTGTGGPGADTGGPGADTGTGPATGRSTGSSGTTTGSSETPGTPTDGGATTTSPSTDSATSTTVTVGDSPTVTISSPGGSHSAGEEQSDATQPPSTPTASTPSSSTPTTSAPDPADTPSSAPAEPATSASGGSHGAAAIAPNPVPAPSPAAGTADPAPAPEPPRVTVAPSALAARSVTPAVAGATASPTLVPATTSSVPVTLPAPNPVAALLAIPGALIQSTVTLLSTVLTSFLAPGTGTTPDVPLMWGLLAFVRRQFFNSTPTLNPRPGVADPTTGQIYGDLGAADADGDPLTFGVLQGPAHGTVTITPSGVYTYTPNAGYSGTDNFVVTVSDPRNSVNLFKLFAPGGGHVAAAAIIVETAAAANHAPAAGTPAYTITRTDDVTGAVYGHVNVTDPDTGDTLAYSVTTPVDAAVGTLHVDSRTGDFTFTPTAAARLQAWRTSGVDPVAFTVTASDGDASTNVAVTVAISPAVHFVVVPVAANVDGDLGNQGLAVGADGRYYTTTYQIDESGELVVLNPDGSHAATVDVGAVIPHPVTTAYDIVVAPNGKVYVSGETGDSIDDIDNGTAHGVIVVIDPDDGYSASVFAQTAGPASALAVDGSGRVYVANWNNGVVAVFDADGTPAGTFDAGPGAEDGSYGVAGLAFGSDGRLYATRPALGTIDVLSPGGPDAATADVGGQPWAIAFGANGAAYVTDLSTGTVTVIGADGSAAGTVSLGAGTAPYDVTTTADGRVYVMYADADGTTRIAEIAAVPVAEPDGASLGDPVAGVPVGSATTSPLVVATDVVYQTIANADPLTGAVTTTIAVVTKGGTTTPVRVPGQPAGAAALGGGDVLYQAVQSVDATGGAVSTGIVAVTPSGTTTFSGFTAGAPVGGVLLSTDGTAYQTVLRMGDDGSFTTTVIAFGPTGATTHDIAGAPPLSAATTSNLVPAPDGSVYVTTVDVGSDATGPTTTVTVIGATGVTTHRLDGLAVGPVTVAPDGSVRQVTGLITTDPDTGETTVRTTVAVLTDTGFTTLPDTLAGFPVGGLQSAADGTIYQAVIAAVGSDDPTTTIAEVTPSGLVPVFQGLTGTPTDAAGRLIPVVIAADGSVYQTTSVTTDAGTVTYLAVKAGTVLATSPPYVGQPVGPAQVGSAGTVYQTVYDADADVTRVVVVTPTGTTVHELVGSPGDPELGTLSPVVVGPDDSAYLTVAQADSATGADLTTVARITSSTIDTGSVPGTASGPVTFGAAGTPYLTVESFDTGAQKYVTTVLRLDTGEAAATIDGRPAGPVAVGPDGAVYQSVIADVGSGGSATGVHVVATEPEPFTAVRALAAGDTAPVAARSASTTVLAAAASAVGPRSAKVNGEVFLQGKYIQLGVSPDGSFGTSGSRPLTFAGSGNVGLVYDFDGFGTGTDKPVDIYLPGTPEERWSVGWTPTLSSTNRRYAGFSTLVGNGGNAASLTGTSVVDQSSGDRLQASSTGTVSGSLQVTQTHTFNANNSYYTTTVTIKNVSGTRLENVEFMRSFDPDNTKYQGGDYNTDNVINGQLKSDKYALVTATSFAGDPYQAATGKRVTSFIMSNDARAVVYNGGFSNSNPYDFDAGQSSGTYTNSDTAIGIVFKVDALNNGESKTFTYYTGVTTDPSSAAIIKLVGAATTKATPAPRKLDETPVGITGNLWTVVRNQPANALRVDIVKSAADGKLKVIAYIGGTGDKLESQIRNIPAALDAIDYSKQIAAIKQAAAMASSKSNPSPEIMLVGYSQGGMDAQNIAFASTAKKDNNFNVTTLVTFASPITHSDSTRYESIHLRAAEDRIPHILVSRPPLPTPGVYLSDAVFESKTDLPEPPAVSPGIPVVDWVVTWAKADVHQKYNSYLTVANDFTRSTDPKFNDVKDNIIRFKGSIVLASANQMVLPSF